MPGQYTVNLVVQTIFPDGDSRQDVAITQRGLEYDELVVFQQGLTKAITKFFFELGDAAVELKKQKK